jgi:hypothetical protein
MQQLVLAGEIGVEETGRHQTEQAEPDRAQSRQDAERHRQAGAELQQDGGNEQRRADAKRGHGFLSTLEMRRQLQPLMHEDQGQKQSAGKQDDVRGVKLFG